MIRKSEKVKYLKITLMAGFTIGTVNLSLLRRLAALGAGAIFKDKRDGNEEQLFCACLSVASFETY